MDSIEPDKHSIDKILGLIERVRAGLTTNLTMKKGIEIRMRLNELRLAGCRSVTTL